MAKFDTITGDQGKKWLLHYVDANEVLEPYAQTWLQSVRNPGFLHWTLLDSGYKRELYSDVSSYIRLSDWLKEAKKPHSRERIILEICEAVLTLQDSLLDQGKLSLDTKLIWIARADRRKTTSLVKMTYLPIDSDENSLNDDFDRELRDLLEVLVQELLSSYGPIRKKKLEAGLQAAITNGPEAMRQAISGEVQDAAIPFVSAKSKKSSESTVSSEATDSSESSNSTGSTNEQTENTGPTLPFLILLAEAILLAGIYLLDLVLGQISLPLLMLMLGIIAILCICQVFLLFHRASPYCVREPERNDLDLHASARVPEPVLPETINVNPSSADRTAVLTLLTGSVRGQKDHSWQILGSEFLLGSDPDKCQLLLPESESGSEVVLRICQRAGVFFAQALSSTKTVWLQGRMLYRYEDYQLPDECQLRVAQVLLRFRAY